jgi:hypothetical protein
MTIKTPHFQPEKTRNGRWFVAVLAMDRILASETSIRKPMRSVGSPPRRNIGRVKRAETLAPGILETITFSAADEQMRP